MGKYTKPSGTSVTPNRLFDDFGDSTVIWWEELSMYFPEGRQTIINVLSAKTVSRSKKVIFEELNVGIVCLYPFYYWICRVKLRLKLLNVPIHVLLVDLKTTGKDEKSPLWTWWEIQQAMTEEFYQYVRWMMLLFSRCWSLVPSLTLNWSRPPKLWHNLFRYPKTRSHRGGGIIHCLQSFDSLSSQGRTWRILRRSLRAHGP